ncbi:MAG: hypothetical protein ACFB2W_05925 [Leptolyngbyaceae cyanobacterium]
MDTDSLRLLWRIISNLSPDSLMGMTHEELTQALLQQLGEQHPLGDHDWSNLTTYLRHKEHLIRELFCE